MGYVLNVHEGPNAFRYKGTEDRPGGAVFEEGMVTTDEPGIYIEGKYGIRLENELVCQKGEKNEYGQFMYFENLTYVPFDLDAIDPKQMTEVEKKRLNDYQCIQSCFPVSAGRGTGMAEGGNTGNINRGREGNVK